MIISRTPYRISLFGGGTDFPAWYLRHGGAVLAGSLNKYCYITVRYLPPFLGLKHRIVWSKIEGCQEDHEIQHPVVRAAIEHLAIDRGLEVHHQGDLPARSGMGSSSAFTVGLLHALHALNGRMVSKHSLGREAIYMEQEILKEHVGSQDQISAAYGGLNYIQFLPNGEFLVDPLTIPPARTAALENHLMLFFTGISRTSSEVQADFVASMESKRRQLRIMGCFVEEAVRIISSNAELTELGELLREGWDTKRSLASRVSSAAIDRLYDRAIEAGATGGKITGAGAGGFLLLFVPPKKQSSVLAALKELVYVPVKFEYQGSRIIFADHETVSLDADSQSTSDDLVTPSRLGLDSVKNFPQ